MALVWASENVLYVDKQIDQMTAQERQWLDSRNMEVLVVSDALDHSIAGATAELNSHSDSTLIGAYRH